MAEHYTATAGFVQVERTDTGWTVIADKTGMAASWRSNNGILRGDDDPAVGLQRALEAVGVKHDEAYHIARIIAAGGEVG